jgi:peptidoglycan/LPS O-acetylase OafA/YrhL
VTEKLGSVAKEGAKPHREFPCFNGLRAIAAVSVLLVHTAFPSGFTTSSRFWGAYTARLEIGVAVFFLISGFLLYRPFVAAHLGDRPSPAVRPYLRRRFLRIVPAYWVALFFAAFVLHTATWPIGGLRAIIIYFGFLQIYFRSYAFHGITAAWTLCVEMSFYLFLPLYAWAVARWARRRPVQARLRCEILPLVGLVVVSVIWRAVVFANPSGQQLGGAWLPAQVDQFAVGMGLAVTSVWWSEHRTEPAVLARRWLPATSCLLALGAFWAVSTRAGLPRIPIWSATFGQALTRQSLYIAFAFFLLLPAIFGPQHQGLVRGLLRSRPVVGIGLVSYGIYLWHEAWIAEVFRWLNQPLFRSSFLALALGAGALSLVTAVVSYVFLEQPFQRLGRRRAGAPAPTPASVDLSPPISPDGGGPTGTPVPARLPPD